MAGKIGGAQNGLTDISYEFASNKLGLRFVVHYVQAHFRENRLRIATVKVQTDGQTDGQTAYKIPDTRACYAYNSTLSALRGCGIA